MSYYMAGLAFKTLSLTKGETVSSPLQQLSDFGIIPFSQHSQTDLSVLHSQPSIRRNNVAAMTFYLFHKQKKTIKKMK